MAKAKRVFNPQNVVIENEKRGIVWNHVSDSEKFGELADFLKLVDYSERKYTSIDAYVQFKKATEVFGPFGRGWGVRDIQLLTDPIPMTKQTRRGAVEGHQILVKALCWYIIPGDDVDNQAGLLGEAEIMEDIFLDASGDSMKKITTGLLTKFLSYLGWNYDVFSGRFNDVKTFEATASDEEIQALKALCKKIKPGPAKAIIASHDKRGWFRSEVQADMKKINEALAAKASSEKEPEEGGSDAESPGE